VLKLQWNDLITAYFALCWDPGAVYLVILRGNVNAPIFFEDCAQLKSLIEETKSVLLEYQKV